MHEPVRVNMHEAKTQFSRLVARALAGEDVVIARDGQPVLKLVPLRAPRKRRELGGERGKFAVPADFDDTPEGFEEKFYT
jgi:prevent-host-death family protein